MLPSLIAGTHALVVRIEDDPLGLRLYFDRSRYALVVDAETAERIRGCWAGSMVLSVPMPPPECVFDDDDYRPAPASQGEG